MAIDTATERLAARTDIKDDGFLATLHLQQFTAGVKIAPSIVTAWAIDVGDRNELATPGNAEERDVNLVVAALVGDTNTVLTLKIGDFVIIDGDELEILDPGPVSPNRAVTTGAVDPILFKVRAGVRFVEGG